MASLVTRWPFFSLFTPTVISRSTNRFLIETFISAIFRHWLFFSRPVFFFFFHFCFITFEDVARHFDAIEQFKKSSGKRREIRAFNG